MYRSMQRLVDPATCPVASSVRSRDRGSRSSTISAPWYDVEGSWRVATTSTGPAVVRLNGPRKWSSFIAGHLAHASLCHTQLAAKSGANWAWRAAARGHTYGFRGF